MLNLSERIEVPGMMRGALTDKNLLLCQDQLMQSLQEQDARKF